MTGTYVSGDKKFVFLSGTGLAGVAPGRSGDHLVEQMLPIHTWGVEFAIVPIPARTTGDHVKFLGSESGTSVHVLCSSGWE